VIDKGRASKGSDSAVAGLQQTLKKVNLPYVDGLYDMQTSLTIWKNKDRENVGTSTSEGISLRGFSGQGWLYASSSMSDPRTTRRLVGKLKTRREAPAGKLRLPEPIELDRQLPIRKSPEQIPLEEKLQKIREIFSLARNMDSKVADVRVFYSESIMERSLLTCNGTFARQRIPRTRIALQVIVKENGVTEYDLFTAGGTVGYETVDELTEEIVRDTVQGAAEQLKAVPPPRGLQKVIIDPGTVGTVCHESFGHGLEADQALRGRSYLSNMLGKRVASEHVTIYDDSSLEKGHGTYYFDDDGVPSRKNVLVDKGILVSFLHDIETSAAMDAPLTASSRVQDASRRRLIRMSNTYAEPGDWKIDEMVKETKSAVMMNRWQYGVEDPLGGGMQVVSRKGYLIENGVKTKPLKSITLTGRVLEILGRVDAVSKDGFTLDSGNCGKGKEDFVPVSNGGTWWRTTGVIG
jgi:TldD protein